LSLISNVAAVHATATPTDATKHDLTSFMKLAALGPTELAATSDVGSDPGRPQQHSEYVQEPAATLA
jgi:hypothetical protein